MDKNYRLIDKKINRWIKRQLCIKKIDRSIKIDGLKLTDKNYWLIDKKK